MYNYKQLLAFVTVVDEGGFSPAAKKLFITQPAVSWQIKSMENVLDVLLIERSEREITLTPAGEILYHNAKIIIAQYQVLGEDIEQYKTHANENLRIAASTIPGEYILPGLLKAFKQAHAQIHTKVYISDSNEVIDKVISGSICLGIIGYQPDHPDLEISFFASDCLKLVCAADVPLHGGMDLMALTKETLIMREEGSGTRAVTLDYLKQHGCPMDRLQNYPVFGSTKSSLSAIESGLGIGWLSESAIKDALKLGHIRVLGDSFDIPRPLYFIQYKKRKLSPSAAAFKRFVNLD